MIITLEPIATVHNDRPELGDDGWGEVESRIELSEGMPTEALDGVEVDGEWEVQFVDCKPGEVQFVEDLAQEMGLLAWQEPGEEGIIQVGPRPVVDDVFRKQQFRVLQLLASGALGVEKLDFRDLSVGQRCALDQVAGELGLGCEHDAAAGVVVVSQAEREDVAV